MDKDTSHLMELFVEQLKDILWAEKALIKAFPKMITLATSDDLNLVLMEHLEQTHEHVTRLAKVFKSIDKKPSTVKCDAMEGLIAEATEMMEDCVKGPRCDAGIIAAAQKIKHYEMATYGTLREFAETLGLLEAEILFKETLNEEKSADQKLTDVAVVHGVNKQAASIQV
ncbi:MAG: ferritin-like domain-containing protein [Balneolaceae bacterium]